ncbi:MAG: hypothetical protein J7M25_05695 [Deltaproteobacteria bacterium]|nr:hypothetical protein [Deltaproteobacteria bacterium]
MSHAPTPPVWRSCALPNRGQAGITLTEVLISMLLVVGGLLGLTRVASVAVSSNSKSFRMDQAVSKAQARLEALRNVPTAALSCLAGGSAPSACVSSCTAAGGEQVACQTAMGTAPGNNTDQMATPYQYAFLVRQSNANVYDIQVLVTFNDDSVDPPKPVRILLRTAEFR